MTLDNFLTFENIVSILIITLLMINMCMSIVIDDKVYGTLSLLYLLSIPLLLAYPLTYALVILFIQMIIITRKKYEKNHKTIYRKIDKYTRLKNIIRSKAIALLLSRRLKFYENKKLSETATLPDKNHNAAGFDLYASKDVVIEPGQKAIIPTDIAIELPENTFAHIVGRSGITAKTHINVLTGTIDNDYRGPLGIIVQNTLPAIYHHNRLVYDLEIKKLDRTTEKIEVSQPRNSYLIKKGDKVAQLVLYKSVDVELEVVSDLTSTSRNENGFGSSGV